MNIRAWRSYGCIAGRAAAWLAAGLMATAAIPACAADQVISTQSAGQPAPNQAVTGTSAATVPAKVTSTRGANPGEKVVGTSNMQGQAGSDTEQVAALFAQRFPDLAISAVRRTPYGLFEVQVGMDLIYTDANVGWVMQGPLIDAATRRDVTRERRETMGTVPFDQLPLDLAVKQVRGNGSRVVAIFEDPNCGYCKQLRHTLEAQSDLTIYTFIYPILAPDSRVKARDVWCAANPAAAWDDWMLHGKVPASRNCDAPVNQVLALGQRLMVRGTPTLFFADGTRVSGALPQDELLARLNKTKQKGS